MLELLHLTAVLRPVKIQFRLQAGLLHHLMKHTDLGFTYPEPGANFIFVTHPDYPAKELFAALREKDIYVRYFDKPRINNYLRVTIGTDEQMEALFAFLKEYMNR